MDGQNGDTQLTPFDPYKSLSLVIDAASTEGGRLGPFCFSNGAAIVNADCSRFKESQLRSSPIKAEAIALDFDISYCSYWISYCPQVELHSYCSGLLDMLNKRDFKKF